MKPSGQERALQSPEELQRLMRAVAVERDRGAFAMLFSHFAPRVKSFLMRSGLMDTMAEEVAQETMLAIWRKASYFDPDRAGLSTWVFTIARNQRIDRLRRERMQAAESGFAPVEEADGQAPGEETLMAAERDEQVRCALAALSGEQAMIVRMSFFIEKPHAEIARELGIPLGTVKSRIRLALNRLRTLLDGTL